MSLVIFTLTTVKVRYLVSKYLGMSHILLMYYNSVVIRYHPLYDFNPSKFIQTHFVAQNVVYFVEVSSALGECSTYTRTHWKQCRPTRQETELQSHLNHNSLNDLKLITNSLSLLLYPIHKCGRLDLHDLSPSFINSLATLLLQVFITLHMGYHNCNTSACCYPHFLDQATE